MAKSTYNIGDEFAMIHHGITYTLYKITDEYVIVESGLTKERDMYTIEEFDRMIYEGTLMRKGVSWLQD